MGPRDSDRDLLRRYRRGDQDAFAGLVDRYGARLWNYLRRRAGAPEADDLLQEVFLRVVKESRKLARRRSIEAWLFTVARNLVLDRGKTVRNWRSLDGMDIAGAGPGDGPLARSWPEGALEASLLSERVERAIAALPDHEKEVFLLRHHSDLSFREIAALLGVPVNTALSRMHRALSRLRKVLEPAYLSLYKEV